MDYRRHDDRWLRHVFSIPFIYAVIVPVVFLDLIMEIYHRICFPLYEIPLIDRWAYVAIDRQRLAYLTWYEKINCAYCGYVNGVLRYTARIAQESERYWCAIMHEGKPGFTQPEYQKKFLPYGDEKAFRDYVDAPQHEDTFGRDTKPRKQK